MKSKVVSGGLVVVALIGIVGLSGCAVGSATAGYSVSAGSADELKATARSKIIEEAVAQSKAYTDAEMLKLRTAR